MKKPFLTNMTIKRAYSASAVLNSKMFPMGGYYGVNYLASTEYVK